jgi:membrane protease YdiL (CAAX protease family)
MLPFLPQAGKGEERTSDAGKRHTMSQAAYPYDPVALSPPVIVAAVFGSAIFGTGLVADFILARRAQRDRVSLDAGVAAVRARPWHWLEGTRLLMVLATLLALFVLVSNVARQLGHASGARASLAFSLSFTLLMHVAGLTVVAASLRVRDISWRRAFGLAPAEWRQRLFEGTVGYLAAVPAISLYGYLYLKLLDRFSYPVDQQEVITMLAEHNMPLWAQVCLGTMAVLLAPLVEELLFRGIALPIALRHLPPLAAVCLVSILFSLVHCHAASFMALFVFAVALCVAYIATGSILVPVFMHALFNAVNLTAVLLLRDTPLFQAGARLFWSLIGVPGSL